MTLKNWLPILASLPITYLVSISAADACSPPAPVNPSNPPECRTPFLSPFWSQEPIPANTEWLQLSPHYDPDLDQFEEFPYDFPPNKETNLTNFQVLDSDSQPIPISVLNENNVIKIVFEEPLNSNSDYSIAHDYACDGVIPDSLTFTTAGEKPLPRANDFTIEFSAPRLIVEEERPFVDSCDIGQQESRRLETSLEISGLEGSPWEGVAFTVFKTPEGNNTSKNIRHQCDTGRNNKSLPDNSAVYEKMAEMHFRGTDQIVQLPPVEIELNCADFESENILGCTTMPAGSFFSVLMISFFGFFRRRKNAQ